MDRSVLHCSRPIVPVLGVEVFHTGDNALLKVFGLLVFLAASQPSAAREAAGTAQ